MYSFTRSQIRDFLSALRRAGVRPGRGRPEPAVLLDGSGGRYALQAVAPGVALEFAVARPCGLARVRLPLGVLAECAGPGDGPVLFEPAGGGEWAARWQDGPVPKSRRFAADDAAGGPEFPALPREAAGNGPGLWKALGDAASLAGRPGGRYALDCLRLRGGEGRVEATDAYLALAQSGYAFPWEGDLLVPATPLFGCRELACSGAVAVGRAGDDFVLATGPWTVALAVRREGRFPDLDRVLRAAGPSRAVLRLDEADAAFLGAALPKLPGAGEAHRPVTVETDGRVAVRAREGGGERSTELVLSRSRTEGGAMTWRTDRRYLTRALGLGFREFRLASPEAPVVCEDGGRRLAWAPLAPAGALPAREDDARVDSADAPPVSRPAPRHRAAPDGLRDLAGV